MQSKIKLKVSTPSFTKGLFTLSFFFTLLLKLHSQQFNFINYGIEDGLPQSTIYDIFQDQDGYLWLGTDGGGLCRYDGFRFKTYGKKEGLHGNVVKRIAQDKQKTIWVATNNGLYLIKDQKIELFQLIPDNKSIYFASVFVDSKQNIWAASTGKGLYKIETAAEVPEVKIYSGSSGLSNDYIFDISEDQQGRIWIAAYGEGIDVLDPKTEKITHLKNAENKINEVIGLKRGHANQIIFGTRTAGAYALNSQDFPDMKYHPIPGTENNQIWSVEVHPSGNLLIATDQKGIFDTGNEFQFNTKNGLLTNKTFKVYIDREKNIWIGTADAGLLKFLGGKFTHITAKELPELSQVSCVIKDKTNSYWLGTSLSGLYHISIDQDHVKILKHLKAINGLPANEITGLSKGADNLIWISTRKGLSAYNGKSFKNYFETDGIISNDINCVYADKKNRIWIGTTGGLTLLNEEKKFSNISESNGLVHNEVQCFLEDSKGNLWIGTLGGLVCFDGKSLQTFNEEQGLSEKKIHSLAQDKNGAIYIGTFGGGIFRLRTNKHEATEISPLIGDEKLISNNIYSLIFLNDSTLICGTNQGLNKIHFNADFQITGSSHLGRREGFVNLENSLNASLLTEHNTLWFGTTKGITTYHPSLDKKNEVVPQIRLLEFKVHGIAVSDTGHLLLKSDQNTIKAGFVSISLTNPGANVFYAKLEGLDTTWNKLLIDEQNLNEFAEVEYKKLQPGKYRLLLKSKNNSCLESRILSKSFSIALPFYKTTWFILSSLVLIIILIYWLIKVREQQLLRDKVKLEKTVTERTAEVVASKVEIEKQKDQLQIQQKEITDSINYSKRIQNAILPEAGILQTWWPKSFILYQPKDIVSGDFYFFSEAGPGKFYLSVADCTGHGVPGAFMSMVGSKELKEASKINQRPGQILNALNVGLRSTLRQNDLELGIKDGMDIAFLLLEKIGSGKEVHVYFAGANRPLWVIKKDEAQVIEIKATKTAIGGYTGDNQEFQEHLLKLEEGDSLYIFSDGYADQFGGSLGKKMMTKRFKELLLESKKMSIQEQKTYLETYFQQWKGEQNEQVDDVLVIGLRI